MLRVVFFGNSESVFSNRHFQALRETPCQLVGVVDAPPGQRSSTNTRTLVDAPSFVGIARQEGLAAFEPASPNAPEFVRAVSDLKPDLFVAVGYTSLLKAAILSAPRILAANFHASLLPAYRGKSPVFWALRNGERWAGLTVHVMDAGLDTGDILYQVRVRTRRDDSVATLYDRVIGRSVPVVGRLIGDAERRRLRRTAQPPVGASYYSSVQPGDFRLDWSREAEQLRRWIRTSPGRCHFVADGRRVFVLDAEAVAEPSQAAPGVLVRIGRTSCTVATGKGLLRVRRARVDQEDEKAVPRLCRDLGL
ncbi:MAG: methionyl-tRNA formyltransferase, partial [Chloroflexi bacterium]|nr:methionyl-tRNA formyltransferase [Chloroflexota bacterium]